MTPDELQAIRDRDGELSACPVCAKHGTEHFMTKSDVDRRALLAEVDRLRAELGDCDPCVDHTRPWRYAVPRRD